MTKVITYQHTYGGGEETLCPRHVENNQTALGAVQHGEHDGDCEVCAIEKRLAASNVTINLEDEHGVEHPVKVTLNKNGSIGWSDSWWLVTRPGNCRAVHFGGATYGDTAYYPKEASNG